MLSELLLVFRVSNQLDTAYKAIYRNNDDRRQHERTNDAGRNGHRRDDTSTDQQLPLSNRDFIENQLGGNAHPYRTTIVARNFRVLICVPRHDRRIEHEPCLVLGKILGIELRRAPNNTPDLIQRLVELQLELAPRVVQIPQFRIVLRGSLQDQLSQFLVQFLDVTRRFAERLPRLLVEILEERRDFIRSGVLQPRFSGDVIGGIELSRYVLFQLLRPSLFRIHRRVVTCPHIVCARPVHIRSGKRDVEDLIHNVTLVCE